MRIAILFLIAAQAFAQGGFGASKWNVKKVGPSAQRPATCSGGRDVFVCVGSGCSPDPNLQFCVSANAWGDLTGSGGGAVDSVFGRTGTVIAATNDYTAAQVQNAADKTAANAYTAGAKQSVSASATLAGLKITCAALPSAPVTGDVACDSGDANLLKWYDGSTWNPAGTAGGVTTGVTLTSNLPVIGAGSGAVAVGTRSGNTTQYVTTTGAQTSGDCVKIDANGNHVANGSACGGGSGGLVLVEQRTASASATLNFTSCISSTYDEYLIEFVQVIPASNNVAFLMRVSTDAGSNYISATDYSSWTMRFSSGGAAFDGASGATAIDLTKGGKVTDSANYGVNGHIRLFNPLGAIYKVVSGQLAFQEQVGPNRTGWHTNGAYESSTDVDAFQFYFESGNIASGKIRCYGVAK